MVSLFSILVLGIYSQIPLYLSNTGSAELCGDPALLRRLASSRLQQTWSALIDMVDVGRCLLTVVLGSPLLILYAMVWGANDLLHHKAGIRGGYNVCAMQT